MLFVCSPVSAAVPGPVFGFSVSVSGDKKEKARQFRELLPKFESEKTKTAYERRDVFKELASLDLGPANKILFDAIRNPKEDILSKDEILRAYAGPNLSREAAVFLMTESFSHIRKRSWKVIGEVLSTAENEKSVDWMLTKGFKAIPTVEHEAQLVLVSVLEAFADKKGADAADKLLLNRKLRSEVQAELIRVVRKAKRVKSTKKVAKLFRWQSKEIMVEALRFMQAVKASEQSKLFYDGLESSHWEVRAASLDILGATRNPEMLKHLAPMLKDHEATVQLAAVHAIRAIGGNAAMDPLLEALDHASGRVMDDLLDALIWLTGKDLGVTPISWQAWWKTNRDTVEIRGISREEYEALLAGKEGGRTSTYYGLRVISNFVTFVVDISGSMEEKYRVPESSGDRGSSEKDKKGGATRVRDKSKTGKGRDKRKMVEAKKIEVAKKELIRVLGSVRQGTQFNLVPFSSLCTPWKPELVAMDEEVLEQAIAYIRKLKSGGETNVYDTLLHALADPKVNTIYFLSDGAPTAGKIQDHAEIIKRITELNSLRKVKIHAIGFKLDPKAKKLMRNLAEQNYGTFLDR